MSHGQVPYGHFSGQWLALLRDQRFRKFARRSSSPGGPLDFSYFLLTSFRIGWSEAWLRVKNSCDKFSHSSTYLLECLDFTELRCLLCPCPSYLAYSMNLLAYLEGEKTDELCRLWRRSLFGLCDGAMAECVIFYLLLFWIDSHHVKQKKFCLMAYQFLCQPLWDSLLLFSIPWLHYCVERLIWVCDPSGLWLVLPLPVWCRHLFANLVYYCLLLLTLGFASAFCHVLRKVLADKWSTCDSVYELVRSSASCCSCGWDTRARGLSVP